MTRTQKAISHISAMPKNKLVTSNIRAEKQVALETINSRRFVTIDSNHGIVTCKPSSPNIWGLLGEPNGVSAGATPQVIYQGDALAVAQSSLKPMLPFKIGEDGRIINGIIRHTGDRTVITATNGLDSQITQPNSADLALTAVSASTSDDYTHIVWVYASAKTSGYPMLLRAALNGTTAVNMICYKCPDNTALEGTAALCDEVYGFYKTDVDGTLTNSHGTITIKNTASTTLISSTTTQTTRGTAAVTSTNYRHTYGDKAIITVSAAATDSIFLVGLDEANEPQYEIITYAASMPVIFETLNRWNNITTLVCGKVAAARTVAIAGRPSNVFEAALASDIADVTMTGVTQASGVVWVASSAAADVGAKLTIIGVDTTTVHVEEITLNAADATTAVTSTNNYTQVMGMYVSSMGALTALAGNMTVLQTDGATEMFKFAGSTKRCGGLLTYYKGNDLVAATSAYALHDICGCNARPTITSSNTAATHTFVIYGEDVDGTSQTELATFEDGVWESAYTWSRIFAIAGADSGAGASGFQATEYVKISFEMEDDLGSFAGMIYNAADAQDDEIEVDVGAIAFQRYASGPGQRERVLMQEIVGTTGVTRLDTHASATRTVVFPDSSGTVMMTGASSSGRIITVGADNCDYSTIGAAITAATAGDVLWLMDATFTITLASLDFSKALEVVGMSDAGYTTITAGLTTDATVDISVAGCVFRNITFTASHNGAGDIAVYLKNVGAKFYDCAFNGGTNAAGIAIDLAADGADKSYFYNCMITDGILDLDGNASSEWYWYGGSIADAVNIDTGSYWFYDTTITGAFTTGASAAATIELHDTGVVGALTLTTSTSFKMFGNTLSGAFTHTAGTASAFYDVNFASTAAIVAATRIDLSSCRLASTLGITGAATVIMDDCKVTGAVTQNTAGSTVFVQNCLFDVAWTSNHAGNNLYVYDSDFTEGLIITNSAIVELRDSKFDATTNALTLTANATSFNAYNITITNLYTHTADTASFFNSVIEEIDQNGGTLNLRDCYVTGALAFDGTALNTNHCYVVGALTETSGAGTWTDHYSDVQGNVTNTGGIFTVNYTVLEGTVTGTVTGFRIDQTFVKPDTIVTIGTGCDYATLAAAKAAGLVAGATYLVFATSETIITNSLDFNAAVTVIGMADDCTITSALAADATVDVTADGCEFYNIHFTNTNNGAGDIAINIVNVGAYFEDCIFDGGTNATGESIHLTANGADYTQFINCTASDGLVSIAGNAASNVRLIHFNCDDVGNSAIATGGYEIYNAVFAGNLAIATASTHANDLYIVGTFTITSATIFDVEGLAVDGTFLQTDSTLTDISDGDFASTLTITAGTLFNLSGGNVTGAVVINGGTELNFRNIDFTSTFTSQTAASTVNAYDCKFTGTVTGNRVDANFYGYDCELLAGYVCTSMAIVELNHCTVEGNPSLNLDAIATSFTLNNTSLADVAAIDANLTAYGGRFEEIDHAAGTVAIYNSTITAAVASDSAGTVNIYDSTCVGALTVGAAAAGSTVNLYRGYYIGQVTRIAGTLNVYDIRVVLAVAGTYVGDYVLTNAAYTRQYEGGYAYKYKYYLLTYDNTEPRISGGAEILGWDTAALTGAEAQEGNLAGGAATPGYLRFVQTGDRVNIGITPPDDMIITGTAADVTFEIYADATNVDDKFQYAFYDWDGTELEGMGGANYQNFANAAAAWLQLDRAAAGGQGAILVEGQPIHLFLGNFNVAAGGNVTVDVYAIRMKYPVGKQNHI